VDQIASLLKDIDLKASAHLDQYHHYCPYLKRRYPVAQTSSAQYWQMVCRRD